MEITFSFKKSLLGSLSETFSGYKADEGAGKLEK